MPRKPAFQAGLLSLFGTFAIAGALLAGCGSNDATPSTSGALATYAANNARTGYSTDSGITTTNAASLKQLWSKRETAAISAQAIVHDGVVYWGDWNGIEHATTAGGRSLWSTSIGIAPRPAACPFKQLGQIGVVSSATIGQINGKNALWVGGGNGSMYALDASTGTVIWLTQLGSPPLHVLWSSPAYFDGSVYEGVASWNDCPGVDGSVYRLNAGTGAVQAVKRLSTSASCIGPGVWSSPAIDPSDHSVYVTTSNANPRSNPDVTCQVPDQEAVLKLDARTLGLRASWRLPVDQQVGDSDFGASAMLFNANIGGADRQLVGVENKNGFYYALDRNNLAAGPVWSYRAEDDAALNSSACQDRNTISTSAWAGPGSSVIVAGIVVNGTSCMGTIAALDPATGNVIWKVSVGGIVQGAVTEVPGLIAVGAGRYLQILSSSTGAQLFSFTEPSGQDTGNGQGQNYFFWPPPTIVGDDVFIGNEDGSFRAFGL